MAESGYIHGEMDVKGQTNTWDGFLRFSLWGGLITLLLVTYLTFAIAIGMNWFVSLIITAGVGIVAGLALNMGGAWLATVVALSALAVLVQIIIAIFKAVL